MTEYVVVILYLVSLQTHGTDSMKTGFQVYILDMVSRKSQRKTRTKQQREHRGLLTGGNVKSKNWKNAQSKKILEGWRWRASQKYVPAVW